MRGGGSAGSVDDRGASCARGEAAGAHRIVLVLHDAELRGGILRRDGVLRPGSGPCEASVSQGFDCPSLSLFWTDAAGCRRRRGFYQPRQDSSPTRQVKVSRCSLRDCVSHRPLLHAGGAEVLFQGEGRDLMELLGVPQVKLRVVSMGRKLLHDFAQP